MAFWSKTQAFFCTELDRALQMSHGNLPKCGLGKFNAEIFEKKIFKIFATFLCEIFPQVFGRMPCFFPYCMFQMHLKSRFSLIFHERVATRACVRRLETPGSGLEKFNTEVSKKKFSKFLQLFLCEIFPQVFGRMHFPPLFFYILHGSNGPH